LFHPVEEETFCCSFMSKVKLPLSNLLAQSLTQVWNFVVSGAAFMIGRAITAAHWGLIADVYGRKPVIVIGLISV
jgi:MFS family permease